MNTTRRQFIASTAALGTITLLPFAANAAAHGPDSFKTTNGEIVVHPVNHASIVMETPAGVLYIDPVGEVAQYEKFPKPDMVIITHHHGDHFKPETLAGVVTDKTEMVVNPTVMEMLSDDMKAKAKQMANGESMMVGDVKIDAIPAYNLTEERQKFHPKDRDNGYILTIDGLRVYVSGDTEDIPEMRALENIDLAFVCMNLPFTMDAKAAASAVSEFKPKFVYPYHYRGKDDGTQDPKEFAKLVGDDVMVKFGDWYG